MRGCGSGYRSSSRFISSHDIHARCERRLNHFRHTMTRCRSLRSALRLPMTAKYPKCPSSFRVSAVHCSQRARTSWENMNRLLERYPLPQPRIRYSPVT